MFVFALVYSGGKPRFSPITAHARRPLSLRSPRVGARETQSQAYFSIHSHFRQELICSLYSSIKPSLHQIFFVQTCKSVASDNQMVQKRNLQQFANFHKFFCHDKIFSAWSGVASRMIVG